MKMKISGIRRTLLVRLFDKKDIFREKDLRLSIKDFQEEFCVAVLGTIVLFLGSGIFKSNGIQGLVDGYLSSIILIPLYFFILSLLLFYTAHYENKKIIREKNDLLRAYKKRDPDYLLKLLENKRMSHNGSKVISEKIKSYVLSKEDVEVFMEEVRKQIEIEEFESLLKDEKLKKIFKKAGCINYNYICQLLLLIERTIKENNEDELIEKLPSAFFKMSDKDKYKTI